MQMKVTVNRFQRVASNQNNLQIISLSAICECFVGATAAQVCTSCLINDEMPELNQRKLYKSWWESVHIKSVDYAQCKKVTTKLTLCSKKVKQDSQIQSFDWTGPLLTYSALYLIFKIKTCSQKLLF